MPIRHFDQQELEKVLRGVSEEKTLVLVTGVFDLLHEEHLRFLQKAKESGEFLLVGIEPDSRVKQLKGENRPIWDQDRRYAELKKIKEVDEVFILPEEFFSQEEREKLIAFIRPSILAVSSHTPHLDKKRLLIEKYGGVVKVVHEHNPEISTTKILNGE